MRTRQRVQGAVYECRGENVDGMFRSSFGPSSMSETSGSRELRSCTVELSGAKVSFVVKYEDCRRYSERCGFVGWGC
jgi:hypothetical protein